MIYSHALLRASLLDGTASVTVPATETWVVRDIEIVQGDLVTAGQILVMSGTLTFYWDLTPVSGRYHIQWEGRVVLEGGTVLEVQTDTPMDVLISGYRLTA